MPFRLKKEITIDFGEHLTGYFSFSVRSTGLAADGPLRFKLTFGEVPSEVAVPFDSYTSHSGQLGKLIYRLLQ